MGIILFQKSMLNICPGRGEGGGALLIETDWQLFSVNNKIMIFYLENSEVKLCHHRQLCPKVLAPIK